MANRLSLKDRKAQSAQGVDSIITAPKDAEKARAAEENPPRIAPDDAPNEPKKQSEKGEETASPAKVTLYIRPDQVLALEEIQLAERKRTGKRRDKSDLAQEAFDLLIQRYSKA